jgi:co-chaperonin GroES (HSP10)
MGTKHGRYHVVERESIDRTWRGAGIIHPTMYNMQGDRDHDTSFMGEVIEVPSACDRSGYERPAADMGALVICSLFNVGYRFSLGGLLVYSIRNPYIAGILNPETKTVKPAQHFVLVKPNMKRAKRVVTGHSLVELADMSVCADDMPEGIKCEFGEVVMVGPGQYIDGGWVEPGCKPGDMVLFDATHSTVPIMIKGEPYTLVSALQIIWGIAQGDEEEAWIQTMLSKRRSLEQSEQGAKASLEPIQ